MEKTKESHMDPLGKHYSNITLHLQLQRHDHTLSREQAFFFWYSNHTKHFNEHVYPSSDQNFASNNPLTENTWFNLLVKDSRTTTHTSSTT